jgi:hypothetical protein
LRSSRLTRSADGIRITTSVCWRRCRWTSEVSEPDSLGRGGALHRCDCSPLDGRLVSGLISGSHRPGSAPSSRPRTTLASSRSC